jgi:outer membrane receptor for ferrienterochelin and colicin
MILPLLFISLLAEAQKKFTISGHVKDVTSGESLIGASVFNSRSLSGTTSNTYGFYSLTLPCDSVSLQISYVGYEPMLMKFLLKADTTITIELQPGKILNEVTVNANQEDNIQNTTRMSTIDLPIEQIKAMPALLGEVDVLKVLQLLPGVQSGTEGSSGLYVRGGGPDQNLILLDGVPVYNASHLFGFFSVFNADAINRVELIKGGFPARYGGRLSSVIDISMKEGNMKEIKGEGSIGLVASKVTVEGPIIKDRTSFIISGRRTYIDLLTRPLIKKASDGDQIFGYFFYDVNAKINHKVNDRNRLYLSAYAGDDKAYMLFKDKYKGDSSKLITTKEEAGLRWGNITTAFRWNTIWNNKLFSNFTATYSRYRFKIFDHFEERATGNGNIKTTSFKDEYSSGIRDYALKLDFDYLPNPNHYVKLGVQGIQHLFTPGVYSYRSNVNSDTTFGNTKTRANEFFAYVEDDIRVTDKMKWNVGFHTSGFSVDGKFYGSFQPRISARYLLSPTLAIKSSYAKMTQYIHLLTNAGLGLPTDLWVPSTPSVNPEQSYVTSMGVVYNLNSTYELSLEGYYKKMEGLVEYKEGASFIDLENDWQTKIEIGEGESYGAELFAQKKLGKVNGWFGYTLSWTNRKFENLNFGRSFPYKYDRRHDLELALAYQLRENKELSLTWVYGTGTALSLPESSYIDYPRVFNSYTYDIKYYENRNNYRMRAYHRLDLSYTSTKKTKWGTRSWSIGIYNVYNRKNPFYIDIGHDKNGKRNFIQYSLFPIIPSIAYKFKF